MTTKDYTNAIFASVEREINLLTKAGEKGLAVFKLGKFSGKYPLHYEAVVLTKSNDTEVVCHVLMLERTGSPLSQGLNPSDAWDEVYEYVVAKVVEDKVGKKVVNMDATLIPSYFSADSYGMAKLMSHAINALVASYSTWLDGYRGTSVAKSLGSLVGEFLLTVSDTTGQLFLDETQTPVRQDLVVKLHCRVTPENSHSIVEVSGFMSEDVFVITEVFSESVTTPDIVMTGVAAVKLAVPKAKQIAVDVPNAGCMSWKLLLLAKTLEPAGATAMTEYLTRSSDGHFVSNGGSLFSPKLTKTLDGGYYVNHSYLLDGVRRDARELAEIHDTFVCEQTVTRLVFDNEFLGLWVNALKASGLNPTMSA